MFRTRDARHDIFTFVAPEDFVGKRFALLPRRTSDAGWIWLKPYFFFKERVESSGLHGGHYMKLVDVSFSRQYMEHVIREFYIAFASQRGTRVPPLLPPPPPSINPFHGYPILQPYSTRKGSVGDIARQSLALIKKNKP